MKPTHTQAHTQTQAPGVGLDISAYCYGGHKSRSTTTSNTTSNTSTSASTSTKSSSSSTGSSPSSLSAKNEQKSATIVQSLRNVEHRVFHILENTTNNGKSYAKLLYDTLVHREKRWIDWKLAACPTYEKYAEKEAEVKVKVEVEKMVKMEKMDVDSGPATVGGRGKKRKLDCGSGTGSGNSNIYHYGYSSSQVAVS